MLMIYFNKKSLEDSRRIRRHLKLVQICWNCISVFTALLFCFVFYFTLETKCCKKNYNFEDFEKVAGNDGTHEICVRCDEQFVLSVSFLIWIFSGDTLNHMEYAPENMRCFTLNSPRTES